MIPTAIKVNQQSRTVALTYHDGDYQLSFELLRVLSPSAEVRGHGVGNGVLQHGKRLVGLLEIEPAGIMP